MKMGEKQLLGKSISILGRYSQIILDKKLKPLGLNERQMVLLIHLYEREGIHLEELARFYKINRATVTRAVKKLAASGYVVKTVDTDNAKAYKLYITEEGMRIRSLLMEVFDNWINMLTEGFSRYEIDTAVALIRRMAVNASTYEGDKIFKNILENKC